MPLPLWQLLLPRRLFLPPPVVPAASIAPASNNFVYTKTVKKLVSAGDKLETEKRITKDEYLSLMMNADYTRGQIRKTRHCIIYNNQYIEIDIYPFWKDKAILEIELNDINQEYTLPDFVKVIKEVTDDDKYSNYSLAKLMKNDI